MAQTINICFVVFKFILLLALIAPQRVEADNALGVLTSLFKSKRPMIIVIDDTKSSEPKQDYHNLLNVKNSYSNKYDYTQSKPIPDVLHFDNNKYKSKPSYKEYIQKPVVEILELLRSRAPICRKNVACRTLCDEKDDNCNKYCNRRFECDDGLGTDCNAGTDCDAPEANLSTRGYTEEKA